MLVVTLQLFFFTRVLVAASVGKRIIPRGTFPRKKKKKLKLHSIINFSFEQNVAREWTLNRARRKQLTGHRLVNLTQNFLWLLFESNAFRLFSFASSSGSRVKAETCVAQVAPVWSPVWKKKAQATSKRCSCILSKKVPVACRCGESVDLGLPKVWVSTELTDSSSREPFTIDSSGRKPSRPVSDRLKKRFLKNFKGGCGRACVYSVLFHRKVWSSLEASSSSSCKLEEKCKEKLKFRMLAWQLPREQNWYRSLAWTLTINEASVARSLRQVDGK